MVVGEWLLKGGCWRVVVERWLLEGGCWRVVVEGGCWRVVVDVFLIVYMTVGGWGLKSSSCPS